MQATSYARCPLLGVHLRMCHGGVVPAGYCLSWWSRNGRYHKCCCVALLHAFMTCAGGLWLSALRHERWSCCFVEHAQALTGGRRAQECCCHNNGRSPAQPATMQQQQALPHRPGQARPGRACNSTCRPHHARHLPATPLAPVPCHTTAGLQHPLPVVVRLHAHRRRQTARGPTHGVARTPGGCLAHLAA